MVIELELLERPGRSRLLMLQIANLAHSFVYCALVVRW